MPRRHQHKRRAPSITPQVKPGGLRPAPTFGTCCLGWLLIVWPVAGALCVSTPAATVMPQLTGWDYMVWMFPLVLTVGLAMLCSMIPGYAVAWGLCALGDWAERRGLSRRVVWPPVVALCAMAGAWQLGSVQGCWQELQAWGVRGVFVVLSLLLLWGAVSFRRAIIPSATVVRWLYAGILGLNLLLGGAHLLHEREVAERFGAGVKVERADWGKIWKFRGPGFNPLCPTGNNDLITWTNPNQNAAYNHSILHKLLGTPPPPGTEIRGRLGHTNRDLLIFTRVQAAEAERWIAEQFPGCEWREMNKNTAFRVLEREYCPAQFTACRYTRLPDSDGARRYIVHDRLNSEWIYLRLE